jgi:hypothetical protein
LPRAELDTHAGAYGAQHKQAAVITGRPLNKLCVVTTSWISGVYACIPWLRAVPELVSECELGTVMKNEERIAIEDVPANVIL